MEEGDHENRDSGRFHISPQFKHLPFLVFFFGLFAIFVIISKDVWLQQSFPWDTSISLAIQRLRQPWLDTLMILVTNTGGILSVILVALIAVWLMVKRRYSDLFTLLGSYGGAVIMNILLKMFFSRPRPPLIHPIVASTGYSFPSGHTIAAITFFGLMAVYFWSKRKKFVAVFLGFWVLAVGFSRIYLMVHYPSDVLGALLIGSLWISTVLQFRGWYEKRLQSARIPHES
jgi:undecaprenyl-diphosphatase